MFVEAPFFCYRRLVVACGWLYQLRCDEGVSAQRNEILIFAVLSFPLSRGLLCGRSWFLFRFHFRAVKTVAVLPLVLIGAVSRRA